MEKPRCKACGVELYFATSPTGKTLPLQHVRNVYQADVEPGDRTAVAKPFPPGRYYVSHYETCTDPGRFSRKGKP